MPETIIIALLTAVVSIGGALIAARSTANKARIDAAAIAARERTAAETAADALYASLCKDQQARIKDLLGQIRANEERVSALEGQARSAQSRIAALEEDNDRLTQALSEAQEQITGLERENENLRLLLKSMKQGPATTRRAGAKGTAL